MYSKYKNTRFQGYDSKKEARRALELKVLEKAGQITDLQEQVPFELIPAQYVTIERTGRKGQPLKPKKKCLERACTYIADFVYTTKEGEKVVEDTKGVRTPDYIIKRKLMLEKYGIKIKEI